MTEASGLHEPTPLAKHIWPTGTRPAVSILFMTYNQEKFVEEALQSFLAQRTTFPVEIIAHDDASTDGTLGILRRFHESHPQLIRILSQSTNQHSRGNRAVSIMAGSARGDYVALCEGDDYWTSPDKLETQISLLEGRPDASGCFHRADAKFEEKDQLIPSYYGPSEDKLEFGLDDLLIGDNFVPTASMVIRREAFSLPEWLGQVPHGDIVILSTAAMWGPLLYIDRNMAVYRKHAGGIHSRDTFGQQLVKCVRTFVTLGEKYDLTANPSLKAGLQYRLAQIEAELGRYETLLNDRTVQHERDRKMIERIMKSRTFRIGRSFTRLRSFLLRDHGSVEKLSQEVACQPDAIHGTAMIDNVGP